MIALFRKEARQMLLGHGIAALVLSFWLVAGVSAGELLLPREDAAELRLLVALAALAQGLLIGLGSFGTESWQRTEAYLAHRGTGAGRAFWAKAWIGLASLALVVAAPLASFGAWNLAGKPAIEGATAEPLLFLAAAASAGLPALALGVFCAQLRRPWIVRWMLALLGACALVLEIRWAASPLGGEDLPSAPSFVAIQALVAAALLLLSSAMFRAGADLDRPWPGRLGALVGATSLALFWLPYPFGVATIQEHLRGALLASYPEIVERRGGELLRVARDERYQYWELDAGERRAAERPLADYRGLGFDPDSYLSLFDARSTPLTWTRPWDTRGEGRSRSRPLEFEGLVLASYDGFVDDERAPTSTGWLFLSQARMAALETRDGAPVRLLWYPARDDLEPSSPSARIVLPLGTKPLNGNSLGLASMLLVDPTQRTLRMLDRRGGTVSLRSVELPAGDVLVRLERVHSLFRMRAGLYEPLGVSDGVVFVGQRDRYVWTREGFVPRSAGRPFEDAIARGVLESEAASAQAWRLEPSQHDGLAFHLDVVDVHSGEVALEHDFRPRTGRQKALAAGALLASLARPPIGELASFAGHPYDARDVQRRGGPLRDPLVSDGSRPWLLALAVALGLVLARSTWRRFDGTRRDRGTRWLWTLSVGALGLPAWALCCVLEPSRKPWRAREPGRDERSVPLLATAREPAPRELSVLPS